eukprot:8699101-Lingulodinium_polyedra.AAC.1
MAPPCSEVAHHVPDPYALRTAPRSEHARSGAPAQQPGAPAGWGGGACRPERPATGHQETG